MVGRGEDNDEDKVKHAKRRGLVACFQEMFCSNIEFQSIFSIANILDSFQHQCILTCVNYFCFSHTILLYEKVNFRGACHNRPS